MQGFEDVDYGAHTDDTFNVWVELGAKNPDDQRILDLSPIKWYTIKVKSSSPEAEALIHTPLEVLLERNTPGVTQSSRVTSRVVHHERGLWWKIIFVTATVDEESGDVTIDYDKHT